MARYSTKTTSLLAAWFGLLVLVASAGTTSAESWLRKANEIDEDNFASALWSDHGPPQRELQKKKMSFLINGKQKGNKSTVLTRTSPKEQVAANEDETWAAQDSSVYTRTSPREQVAANDDETWAGQVRAYHKYARKSCGKGNGKGLSSKAPSTGKGLSSKAPSTGKGLSSKAPSTGKGSSDDECVEEPTVVPVTPAPATTPAPASPTPAPATTPAPASPTPAPATTPAPASPTPAPASPTPAPVPNPTPAPATPAFFPSSQPSEICADNDRGPGFSPSDCNQPTNPDLKGNGDSCEEDDDCCSCCCNTNGVCNAGNANGKNKENCQGGSEVCIVDGNGCKTTNNNCCSGICDQTSDDDGVCKAACINDGGTCDDSAPNCCSKNCIENGKSGTFKCNSD